MPGCTLKKADDKMINIILTQSTTKLIIKNYTIKLNSRYNINGILPHSKINQCNCSLANITSKNKQ